MQLIQVNVKQIIREVVEECSVSLETDKEEILHLRMSRKKKNADRKWQVKWLGVIFDDPLDFDMHWKSRILKARKALRVPSGVGASQWDMCPGDGKKHIRAWCDPLRHGGRSWVGGVAGMAEGLARVRRGEKVIILANSMAAIAAV